MEISEIREKMNSHYKIYKILVVSQVLFFITMIASNIFIKMVWLSYISFVIIIINCVLAIYHAKCYHLYKDKLAKLGQR